MRTSGSSAGGWGAALRDTTRSALSALAVPGLAIGLLWPTTIATSPGAEAGSPGKTYCYYRTCHRVMTLEETRRAVGRRMVLRTSYYDDAKRDRFNPRNLTASGEWFRPQAPDNAASPKLPTGTVILAWNPATKQAAVLRINNAGPYWGNRTLDVSRAAAERMGFARRGVATLHAQVISPPTREDVTYRKGRRYAPVPGHIGPHTSFEVALAEAGRMMGRPSAPGIAVAAVAATLPISAGPAQAATVASGEGSRPALPSLTSAEVATASLPLETPTARLAGSLASAAVVAIPPRQAALESDISERTRLPFEAQATAALRNLPGTPRAPAQAVAAAQSPALTATARPVATPPRVASLRSLTQAGPTTPTVRSAARPTTTTKAAGSSKPQAVRVGRLAGETTRATSVPTRASRASAATTRAAASQRQRIATRDLDDDDDDDRPVRAPRRAGYTSSDSDGSPRGSSRSVRTSSNRE